MSQCARLPNRRRADLSRKTSPPQTARPPLGYPESILQNHHSPATPLRAHKFPVAPPSAPSDVTISLSMALSSSASASNRFSRLFSCSSPYSFGEALRLEAFGLTSFHSPVKLLPAEVGRW